jgi:hypothetical protein
MKATNPKATQHSVHPTGGSLRVFRQFARLEVVSDKIAFSRPTHRSYRKPLGALTDISTIMFIKDTGFRPQIRPQA